MSTELHAQGEAAHLVLYKPPIFPIDRCIQVEGEFNGVPSEIRVWTLEDWSMIDPRDRPNGKFSRGKTHVFAITPLT